MKEIWIRVKAEKENIISDILTDLSRYECDFHLDKHDRYMRYPFAYNEISYTRLGEKAGRSPEEYRKDMLFYGHASNALSSYGLSPRHKGFKYAIECIRLIIIYGIDDFTMSKDVYPMISKWYNVSENSIEHDVRNAIGQAWLESQNTDIEHKSNMAIFAKRPSNTRFLKHLAKITNYSLCDAMPSLI